MGKDPVDELPEVELEKINVEISVVENVTPDTIDQYPEKENHLYFTVITESDVREEHLNYLPLKDRPDILKPLVIDTMDPKHHKLAIQIGLQALVEILAGKR